VLPIVGASGANGQLVVQKLAEQRHQRTGMRAMIEVSEAGSGSIYTPF